MNIVNLFKKPVNEEKYDFSSNDFIWLESPWDQERWIVSDPGSKTNTKKLSLRFDVPIRSGVLLSDEKYCLEDIKRSIALSIELSGSDNIIGSVINSHSKIRSRASAFKRIVREMNCIGISDFSALDEDSMVVLLNRLRVSEVVSMKYSGIIEDYLNKTDITEWPVKLPSITFRDKATIDRVSVCSHLGLDHEVAKGCGKTRSLWSAANERLSRQYSEYKWDVSRNKNENVRNKNQHEKSFDSYIQTLESYYTQSQNGLWLFEYPIHISAKRALESSRLCSQKKVFENSMRTKNIPVETWFKLMNVAALWVIDYSSPLIEIDREARKYFEDKENRVGRYQAGKITGEWLKKKGGIHGDFSPFPLSSYGHYQVRAEYRKYESKFISDFSELLQSGISPMEIRKRLDLRAPQYDYLRKITLSEKPVSGSRLSLHAACYSFLPLCCVLILLAFTAGREHSIQTLKAGCIKKTEDGLYIEMYIPKTIRDYDLLPTVEIVRKAVEVLEDLSKTARDTTGEQDLLKFFSVMKSNEPLKFRWDSSIDRFLSWIGLDMSNGDIKFRLNEHQFRRFFAMMYFYRYDGKFQLAPLMRFMRHLNWGMTSDYLTEQANGDVFKEVMNEKISELIVNSVEGRSEGGMADEFKRRLNANTSLISEKLSDLAIKEVETGSYVIDFVPDGVCFGRTPDIKSRSKCLVRVDGESAVMTHRADKDTCSGCANLLTTSELNTSQCSRPKQGSNSNILNALLG